MVKLFILVFVFLAAVGLIGYDLQKTSKFFDELNSQKLEFKHFSKINKMPQTNLIYYKNGSRTENKIALTFDDGPSPDFTPQVLDILAKYNVRATFFVLGKWVELYPDIIQRMKSEGHLIGNHSYSHDKNVGDFQKADEIFLKILGPSPDFLRPPYGSLDLVDKAYFGKKIILWDVEARDWERPEPDIIVARIIANAKNGSIILLHDGSKKEAEQKERPQNMILALPKIIEGLQKRFQLVRIDELELAPLIPKSN